MGDGESRQRGNHGIQPWRDLERLQSRERRCGLLYAFSVRQVRFTVLFGTVGGRRRDADAATDRPVHSQGSGRDDQATLAGLCEAERRGETGIGVQRAEPARSRDVVALLRKLLEDDLDGPKGGVPIAQLGQHHRLIQLEPDSARSVMHATRSAASAAVRQGLELYEAMVLTELGDRDAALRSIEIVLQQFPQKRDYVATARWFSPLHTDPRFTAALGLAKPR